MEFSLEIRPALPKDKEGIVKLLSPLKEFYPGVGDWLEKRLNQVFNNEARASVAYFNGDLVGVAIGILKSGNRYKLSTFFVKEEAQHLHIGSMLFSVVLSEVKNIKAETIYLTADSTLENTVGDFFEDRGFVLVDTIHDKYQKGHDENVYVLTLN